MTDTDKARAIAAAKEAVVEAAKGWAGNHSLSSTIRANLADALRDAIAHLLEVESEHG